MDAEKIVSIVEAASRSCHLRNHPDRADLEQDAAVAVLMAIPKLREGNPDGYLYRTAMRRMQYQLRRNPPVIVELSEHGASMPERLEALGEWWAARVRAEVEGSKGGKLLSRLWGLDGDEVGTAELAAELGLQERILGQKARRTMQRLRKSKAIRELHEMARNSEAN
jgi:hypothetical protein